MQVSLQIFIFGPKFAIFNLQSLELRLLLLPEDLVALKISLRVFELNLNFQVLALEFKQLGVGLDLGVLLLLVLGDPGLSDFLLVGQQLLLLLDPIVQLLPLNL